MWEETKPGKGKKFFSLLISIIFERLNYGCFQGVLFSKPFGGNILKFVRGGRNIQWMRGVYNIGPQKLFLFLTYFVYSRYTIFLSQNLFKLSQLVLKWPWSCRSNLQKCLEHLNLAKIIKWKFKFYVKQKELPQILHSKGFFFNLSWRFSEMSKGKCI